MDDGPTVLETSVAMATIAAKDGISCIVATPHTDGIRVNRDSVGIAVDRLNKIFLRENIHIELIPGYEIPYHLVNDLAETHTLGSSNFVLVEFPHSYVPNEALAGCYRLLDKGLQPIIAHPERNTQIIRCPEVLEELLRTGARAQLTAASITGEMGPDVQRCAHLLLRQDLVHFIGTDSHSPSFREPVLSKAFKTVKKLIGRNKAEQIFFQNPSLITRTNVANGPSG